METLDKFECIVGAILSTGKWRTPLSLSDIYDRESTNSASFYFQYRTNWALTVNTVKQTLQRWMAVHTVLLVLHLFARNVRYFTNRNANIDLIGTKQHDLLMTFLWLLTDGIVTSVIDI